MKVKEESEKVGLKLNIQKTQIMASGPITSWDIDGDTVEPVSGMQEIQVRSLGRGVVLEEELETQSSHLA